ncbi:MULTISPECIES: SRPBCC domain-containing protein [unclassified Streptomyces]|uniref:SRPBCC domain-containing protein n=1 Tax=unclassified Streptomyces TaxID=2593676 RepID=UPI002E7FFF23|nr:SRPBCC domain-containing protein [Streptomyces sp. NBC_00589]WTI37615.1 SRPBCC domain-containing protein [Streptomyces sp. NBC_00775]WUB28707.1 SRPBCC domain-containing protein [Streptomyces sp. NBC_00589]
MEHEVFVPVPAERLREALADPVRVARAVPGLQQDAGTPPVSGRLKVRVSGHTITYRGALRVTAQDDGTYAVEGDATEARGAGSVKLALAVRLVPADGGTTLAFSGMASGDGRVAELAPDAVLSAGVRLLGRFAENLGAGSSGDSSDGSSGEGEPAERDAVTESESEPEPEAESSSVFDTEVPPPALDPLVDDELAGEEFVVGAGEPGPEDAMAEAAHARRTMIGRSAEEVDHAPPRGRYAPVPAPEATAARATLRWAAPAAALALASAIALTRALRKRR